MSVPNFKQVILFVQKLLGVPKFRNWATPLLNLKRRICVEIHLSILVTNFYASSLIRCGVMDESNVYGPF